MKIRVGSGFDQHAFASDRPLLLGGVRIPSERGLAGHSDADVLAHAICDALLGAAALGELGLHFPSSDPRWAGAPGALFLQRTALLLRARGWAIGNVDATVIAERPRIAPFAEAMRASVAEALGVELGAVSVKSKSTDGLGAVGRAEGIACLAVALIVGADG